MAENCDTVADPLNILQDVGGIEDRGVLTRPLHHEQDIAAAHRVERRSRLVENQQVGLVDLGLGDTQPLALAAAEALDP
jgi:hypothetical protein